MSFAVPQTNDPLLRVLGEYLASVGVNTRESIVMGPGQPQGREPTGAERASLASALVKVASRARGVLWFWMAIVVVVLACAIALAVYYRDDPKFLAAFLLGGTGVLGVVLRQASTIHTRVVATETLLAFLPSLAKSEWNRVTQALMDAGLERSSK